MLMMSLANKTAAVFCSTGELSQAAAAGLQRAGATVCLAARRAEPNTGIHSVDVLEEAQIESFLRAIRSEHGSLDVIFNGVGPSANAAGSGLPSTQLSTEQFYQTLQTIVGGQWLTARVAARLWQESGDSGTIVLLTSSLSRLKSPNMTSISVASAAVEGLCRTLAAEYGRYGIRVVCVNGTAFTETETIRETARLQSEAAGIPLEAMLEAMGQGYTLGRGPELNEFGDLVAFLASSKGAILNSHIIDADRGSLHVI